MMIWICGTLCVAGTMRCCRHFATGLCLKAQWTWGWRQGVRSGFLRRFACVNVRNLCVAISVTLLCDYTEILLQSARSTDPPRRSGLAWRPSSIAASMG
eukprot:1382547-Pyramimonas_sp.AAC.1